MFVTGMRDRDGDRVIVESTLRMAHALNLKVIAEGVETEWEARFVAEAGCDYAQGFHYSAAKSGAECLRWMTACNSIAANRPGAATAAPLQLHPPYLRQTSGS